MPEPAALPPPRPLAVACLVTAMLVFAGSIGTLAVGRCRLHVATWDLAIFDQACWLLAHGEGTLLTTRNMPVFAHHLNLWLLPLAVLYRLVPGPATLLVVPTLAATAAAIPLFALARRLTRSDACATIWALLYLSYPPLGRMLLHDFHCEPLALPCFVAPSCSRTRSAGGRWGSGWRWPRWPRKTSGWGSPGSESDWPARAGGR